VNSKFANFETPCIGPSPFFVTLFVPVQYLPSIFFDPFHQSLPLCIFHLVFGFTLPILPLLFPISCSSFSYSRVEVPSKEYTIVPVFFHCIFDTFSCCLHLFIVYCYYFHPSSFPFSCRSSLFLFSFCPLIFPFVLFRQRLSPLCFFSGFRFLCPSTFYSPSLYTFSRRFIFSSSSKNLSSVSPLSLIPHLSVSSCILFSPFFLYLSLLSPPFLTSFVFFFLRLSNRHQYTFSHLFFPSTYSYLAYCCSSAPNFLFLPASSYLYLF
jgi:hypothetical protein